MKIVTSRDLLVSREETSMLVKKSMKHLAGERKKKIGIPYRVVKGSIEGYPIAGIRKYLKEKRNERYTYEER